MDDKLLHRKVSIVLATVEVIDQFGIQGIATREVAKRAGISEATIFKHFKSKNDLILAVLEHFSQYDVGIIFSIQKKGLKPIEAIIFFIDTYAAYYENYPAITALTQSYDILQCDPNFSEKIQSIFLLQMNFIKDMVKQAQKEREIRSDINSEDLVVIIMGLQREYCLKWRMQSFSFSLRERTLSSLKIVLEALTLKD